MQVNHPSPPPLSRASITSLAHLKGTHITPTPAGMALTAESGTAESDFTTMMVSGPSSMLHAMQGPRLGMGKGMER